MEKLRLSHRKKAVPVTNGLIVHENAKILRRVTTESNILENLWSMLQIELQSPQAEADLLERLKIHFPIGLCKDILHKFQTMGLIEIADESDNENEKTFKNEPLWSYLESSTESPSQSLKRIKEGKIAVLGDGLLARNVAKALSNINIDGSSHSIDEDISQYDLLIACADNTLSRLRLFPQVGKLCVENKKPWLMAYINFMEANLGPLFIPNETGCYHCLELREESHFPNINEFRLLKNFIQKNTSYIYEEEVFPPAVDFLASAVVMEVIRFLSRVSFPSTYQTLKEFDLKTFETREHILLKVPLCEVCGPHVAKPFTRLINV